MRNITSLKWTKISSADLVNKSSSILDVWVANTGTYSYLIRPDIQAKFQLSIYNVDGIHNSVYSDIINSSHKSVQSAMEAAFIHVQAAQINKVLETNDAAYTTEDKSKLSSAQIVSSLKNETEITLSLTPDQRKEYFTHIAAVNTSIVELEYFFKKLGIIGIPECVKLAKTDIENIEKKVRLNGHNL